MRSAPRPHARHRKPGPPLQRRLETIYDPDTDEILGRIERRGGDFWGTPPARHLAPTAREIREDPWPVGWTTDA